MLFVQRPGDGGAPRPHADDGVAATPTRTDAPPRSAAQRSHDRVEALLFTLSARTYGRPRVAPGAAMRTVPCAVRSAARGNSGLHEHQVAVPGTGEPERGEDPPRRHLAAVVVAGRPAGVGE